MQPLKQIADATTLLSYIMNLFLTFIIAISGAFVREVYNFKKNEIRISIFRLIASALLTSVVMTAVAENIVIAFSIFVLITFLFGMWAFPAITILMNVKYIAIAIKDLLKELGNPVLKGTANAIEDIRKEIKDEKKEAKEEASKEKQQNKDESSSDKKQSENNIEEISKEELLNQIRKLESQIAKEVEEKK